MGRDFSHFGTQDVTVSSNEEMTARIGNCVFPPMTDIPYVAYCGSGRQVVGEPEAAGEASVTPGGTASIRTSSTSSSVPCAFKSQSRPILNRRER